MAQLPKKVFVDLFYDVISPYSWIAFEGLTRYNKKFSNMDLRLHPVFIGAIMQATNNQPPALVPARGKYMNRDLKQLGQYYDLPFNQPKDVLSVMFKKGTLVTQRLLTAVQQKCPSYLEPLSRELFLRIWSKDEDVASMESLKKACNDVGLPADLIDQLLAQTQDPTLKQALKDTTQTAIDYGAFGLPTYVAHLEDGPKMFFGSDRLFMLAHYLNEPFPGPLNELKASKL